MKFSDDLLKWIAPLLYYPEYQILQNHTIPTRYGLGIKKQHKVLKQYKISYRRLDYIRWKLNFLCLLFELEMAAGLI